jgi:hypothetical protein
MGYSDCQGAWIYGTEQWGRGWTAHDTEVVLFTVLALAGGMAAPEVIEAAPGAIEAVGWKALEWTLCHQTLARILGIGGAAAADGDPTNEVRGLLEAGRFQKHHIFPRALRDWFASKGIDIDKYTVVLETTTHLAGVHGRGGLVGPGNVTLPGRWNQLWQVFKDANPNATPKEIYQFAGWLMDRFGLSGLPIVPYD